MTDNDLHYLRSILHQLREVQGALADTASFSLGGSALADNIDWLDCYIERHSRDAGDEPAQQGEVRCPKR